MNIFVLSTDPREAASLHCDVHVRKMIVESAQMISAAVELRGGSPFYKSTPSLRKHPCTQWVSTSEANFLWLNELFLSLLIEYNIRWPQKPAHKCTEYNKEGFRNAYLFDNTPLTPFHMAMKPCFILGSDPVANYRNYYNHKHLLFKKWKVEWTNTDIPSWYNPASSLPTGYE